MKDELNLDLKTGLYSYNTQELLKSDSAVMISAIKENNNSFTLFASKEINELPQDVIDFYLNYLCVNYHGAFQYYYTLRILHLLLKDSKNILKFNKKYIDEQFIKKAYNVNPDIEIYVPNKVLLFTSDKIIFKLLRVIFKFIQTTKASL